MNEGKQKSGDWVEFVSFVREQLSKGDKIGIDIGGCLMHSFNEDKSNEFDPPAFGALEALAFMKEKGVEMFIVSYCGEQLAMNSFIWLQKYHIVLDIIAEDHVIFCKGDKVKAKGRIARALGLTHFVDDRQEILDGMRNTMLPKRLKEGGDSKASVGDPSVAPWVKISTIPALNLERQGKMLRLEGPRKHQVYVMGEDMSLAKRNLFRMELEKKSKKFTITGNNYGQIGDGNTMYVSFPYRRDIPKEIPDEPNKCGVFSDEEIKETHQKAQQSEIPPFETDASVTLRDFDLPELLDEPMKTSMKDFYNRRPNAFLSDEEIEETFNNAPYFDEEEFLKD